MKEDIVRSIIVRIAPLVLPAILLFGCRQDRDSQQGMLADTDPTTTARPAAATKPAPLEEPSPLPTVNGTAVAMQLDAQYAPAKSPIAVRKPVPEPLPEEPKLTAR